MGIEKTNSGPIYVYELDRTFHNQFEFASLNGIETFEVDNALRFGITCNGMHVVYDGNVRRNRWKPLRIVETGMIFPSETHAAYYFGVSKARISQVMHSDSKRLHDYDLEYVKEQ